MCSGFGGKLFDEGDQSDFEGSHRGSSFKKKKEKKKRGEQIPSFKVTAAEQSYCGLKAAAKRPCGYFLAAGEHSMANSLAADCNYLFVRFSVN